jgi:hypothetical protein
VFSGRILGSIDVVKTKENAPLQITVFCSVVLSLLFITLAISRVDFFCADWLWRLVYHGAIKFIEAAVSGYWAFGAYVLILRVVSGCYVRWDDSTQSVVCRIVYWCYCSFV